MSHLHLQLHSQAPPFSSSSSRFSFLKLFTNNTFSFSQTSSLPFKPLSIRCCFSDVFETTTNASSTPNNNPPGISIYRITHFLQNMFRYSEIIFNGFFGRKMKIKIIKIMDSEMGCEICKGLFVYGMY